MDRLFETQRSAEELQQLVSSGRPNKFSQSSRLCTSYSNHESSRHIDRNETHATIDENMAGESLDDIIMQNDNELLRRRNLPRQLSNNEENQRPSLMVDLPNGSHSANDYQFTAANGQIDLNSQRRSSGAFEIGSFDQVDSNLSLCGPPLEILPVTQESSVFRNPNQTFQNAPVQMLENIMFSSMRNERLIEENSYRLNIFSSNFSPNFKGEGLEQMKSGYVMASPTQVVMSSHGDNLQKSDSQNLKPKVQNINLNNDAVASSPRDPTTSCSLTNLSTSATSEISNTPPKQEMLLSASNIPLETQLENQINHSTDQYQNVYCQSGFDMVGALMKVVSRKNPEISIGKVDMSCAFTVCDASKYDCPIIYVSEVFERLTGYNQYEVKGQNCRFLQSPDGKVEAGSKREFVDNSSVYYLKQKILQEKEAQRSVINYRKGGQPFMNILTVIPITGEDNMTIRYFVGFQVDLVEMPASVQGKNANGIYNINYSHSTLPRYIWHSPENAVRQAIDFGQTVSWEDVSTVLACISAGTESELMKRMWDKILLENTDDVVHVLSLKGLFLYLSPSSRHVLEYDASELVGTALSAVCHPSDIVSVTRELKDTSSGAPVNVVFRIRRKKSGYTWFESHGSLCIEQGKGRKCIILVGRERPVYALDRFDIESAGGIGESEMWNKLSTSGMFLFVSSSVQSLLDRTPADLIGTSIQALMRSESKFEFSQALERARTGRIITYKHEILGKKNLMVQAQTNLFPGDASEGQKPTFLVAQTKLLKSSSKNLNMSTKTAKGQTSHPNPSGLITRAGSLGLIIGSQDAALASESNIFDELKTTRCTSWQFELRQMEKSNRLLAEELASLISRKNKRKRQKSAGYLQRDCANCHTRVTPEWRRGPSGHRDLCNSCGLRYAKQVSRNYSSGHRVFEQLFTLNFNMLGRYAILPIP